MVHRWKRPRLNISKTKSEWIWDVIGYSTFIGSVVFLMIVWTEIPEEVPAHFNFKGEVDRFGSKWELFILPGIALLTTLLIQTLEKFPEIHNYPKRFSEANAKDFYLNSRKMVNQLKNAMLIIFSMILFESISIALGWDIRLNKFFMPIVIIGTGLPIIYALMKRRNIK
ncbi:MAG TPA: DUF1648 domain-containing protein [Pseudogracilibacillus sp.]|nr:DUF1648 domain-containing protein [Pseudogracilibacillus sp.]